MKKFLANILAASMALGSTAAKAEVRPEPTTFAIMVNDDDVEIEELGWLWAGVGILAGLGLLLFIGGGSSSAGGQPNSPR